MAFSEGALTFSSIARGWWETECADKRHAQRWVSELFSTRQVDLRSYEAPLSSEPIAVESAHHRPASTARICVSQVDDDCSAWSSSIDEFLPYFRGVRGHIDLRACRIIGRLP
jgi:hypothetical protein